MRKERAFTSLSDVEGQTWACPVGASFVEGHCSYEAECPISNFKEKIATSSQARALRLVLDGKADATAIDARLFDIVRLNCPCMLEQLCVLGTYCACPGPFVVVANHIGPQLKRKIQEAFVTIHHHPFFSQLLEQEHIERFLPLDPYSRELRASLV